MDTIPIFLRSALPLQLWDYILDDFADSQQTWRKVFTNTVLPLITARHQHRILFKHIHFEMLTVFYKKKLESFSAGGLLFKYKSKPYDIYFHKTVWVVSYEGVKATPSGKCNISLLFEHRPEYSDTPAHTIVEAMNVFHDIYDDKYRWDRNYGRHFIEDYDQFISSFMNSLFTKSPRLLALGL